MWFPAGEIEVSGRRLKLEANPEAYTEYWSVMVGGVRITGSTPAKVRAAVATQIRKGTAKIDVPFSRLSSSGQRVERGTVYGRHAGNQNLLVRWASGRTEQLSSSGGVLAPLTEAEEKELVSLHRANRDASTALYDFQRKHHIWLERAVDEALTAEAEKMRPAPPEGTMEVEGS